MNIFDHDTMKAIEELARVASNVRPYILRVDIPGKETVLVLLSSSYTFTIDEYMMARRTLNEGDAILLVDRSAGPTGEAEKRAKRDGIFLGTTYDFSQWWA